MKRLFFCLYIITCILFCFYANGNIILNPYSFGRHWDWSLLPLSEFYRNYLPIFFSSYKPNVLGYFDVVSISLGEHLFKSLIYILHTGSTLLGISALSIPVWNKLAVFVCIPIAQCVGIWYLAKTVISRIYSGAPGLFFVITLFGALAYTFSPIVLFDTHGGALNRIISSAFFPILFLQLHNYISSNKDRYLNWHMLILVLLCAFLDLANVFFFSLLTGIAILFKSQPWKTKLRHAATFGIALLLVNTYWLHSFFVPQTNVLSDILSERRSNDAAFVHLSSTYLQLLFPLNSPQQLITKTYQSPFILFIIPFFLTAAILLNIRKMSSKTHGKNILFATFAFLLISILTGGIYSITNAHHILYNIPILGFIKSALRYVPLLTCTSVYLYLVSFSSFQQTSKKHTLFFSVLVASAIAAFMLTSHNVTQKITAQSPTGSINHDIGALYDYDSTAYESIQNDRLEYNIQPASSWFSPVIVGNIWPPTSQGSLIDDTYIGRGLLQTNGVPLFSSRLFEGFIQSPSPFLFSFTNTGKVLLNSYVPQISNEQFSVSRTWVKRVFEAAGEPVDMSQKLIDIPMSFFYPHVYIPQTLLTSTIPLRYMPSLLEGRSTSETVGTLLTSTPANHQFTNLPKSLSYDSRPTVEYRRISATKYNIKLHNATKNDVIPLIISTSYHAGWKLNLASYTESKRADSHISKYYRPLSDSTQTQASSKAVIDYQKKGFVSDFGADVEKTESIVRVDTGREYATQTQPFVIDYISRLIRRTIQNENMQDVNATSYVGTINDSTHFVANGFSNGWFLHPSKLCEQYPASCLHQNNRYSIQFVMEFAPQQIHQTAIYVSFGTLALIIFYLLAAL